MEYLSFPWEQLGNMLRELSLSGGAGNVTAWILYILLGLCPVFLLLWLIVKGKGRRADLLLPLLSVILFVGLWFLINPSYLETRLFPAGLGEMGKYAFALTIDSILLTWLLLRFLTEYEKMERKKAAFKSANTFGDLYCFDADCSVGSGGEQLCFRVDCTSSRQCRNGCGVDGCRVSCGSRFGQKFDCQLHFPDFANSL